MVVISHSLGVMTALPAWAQPLSSLGHRGVQMFYLLSASMLCRSIATRKEHELWPWAGFIIRRFCRIAPLFWLAMGVHLWCFGLGPRHSLGDAPGITWQNILATATFSNGFNPYWINSIVFGGWSVPVEMSFYLLLPLLWIAIRSLRAALFATVGTLLLTFVLQVSLRNRSPITDSVLWGEYLFLWLPNQLPVFLLGMVFFFLEPLLRPGDSRWLRNIGPILRSACVTAAVTVAWVPFHPQLTPFLSGLAFLGLACSLVRYPSKLWVNGFFARWGLISYSVYLWHAPLIWFLWMVHQKVFSLTHLVLSAGLNQLSFTIILLCVSMPIGILSHHLIERPGIELGRRIIRRMQDALTKQAAAKSLALSGVTDQARDQR